MSTRTPRRMKTVLASTFALSSALWTAPSWAASAANTSAAEALFSEARGLLERGNFSEACAKFEESERLDPGMGTEFYLAKCWEQVGKTASAWAMFRRVASA